MLKTEKIVPQHPLQIRLRHRGVFYFETSSFGSKKPNFILRNIFFSKAQKNLNWPNKKPIATNNTLINGKNQQQSNGRKPKAQFFFVIPSNKQNGLDSQADVDPVTSENDNNYGKLEIRNNSPSLFKTCHMLKIDCKYTRESFIIAVCICFGST